MALLIAGLILFLGAHSTRVFADEWRTRMMDRIGEKSWKGLITVASILGFVLIVIGYGQARLTPVVLWVPPVWTQHLAIAINLLAFIAITAAYVPGNSIKAKIGHPMVAGVKAWAIAHLIANGNLADVILFGAFLIWAVVDFRNSRRHDRTNGIQYAAGTMGRNVMTVVAGTVVWALFTMVLHVRLIGVAPLAMPSTSTPEPAAISAPVTEKPLPATAEIPR
jgi:uncharacterized membrane protein